MPVKGSFQVKFIAHICLSLIASVSLLNGAFASQIPKANDFGWWDGAQPPTQVTPMIWRSGRPTRETLTALYASGVRAIINLEDDMPAVSAEITMAHEIGFKVYSFPTNSFWQPDDSKMNGIVNYLAQTKVPTLIHCLHGEDRTGLVIGLERVFNEKWPAVKAYNEMLDKGFHPILLGLDQYFRDKVSGF
jgi:protein tyrosine phosphatase (PTP) superfamily phosphohydrolase (DUF442 family)